MRASNLWWILLVTTLVLAVAIIMILVFIPSSCQGSSCQPSGPSDVGTILTIVGLAAVVIERVLEGFWNVIDMSVGGFWPLNVVATQIEGKIAALGEQLNPFLERFGQILDQGSSTAATLNPDQIKTDLNNYFDQLKTIAAKNVNSQLFVTGVEQKLRDLQKQYHLDEHNIDINTIVQTMSTSTQEFDKFVQSVKDNPGRRIVSLYLGILLGLATAWAFRLDLIATALNEKQNHSVALGIISAGIVMGLGSSPTHEVVQAIMNWRKGQK